MHPKPGICLWSLRAYWSLLSCAGPCHVRPRVCARVGVPPACGECRWCFLTTTWGHLLKCRFHISTPGLGSCTSKNSQSRSHTLHSLGTWPLRCASGETWDMGPK